MDNIEDNPRGYIGNTAADPAYEKIGYGGKGAEKKAENTANRSIVQRAFALGKRDEKIKQSPHVKISYPPDVKSVYNPLDKRKDIDDI